MKKTFLTMLCGLLFSLAGNAQTQGSTPFAQDKFYAAASLSNFDLSWNNNQKWHLGLDFKGGYMFEDDWMVTATLGWDLHEVDYNAFKMGAGVRYYIEENGLYVGGGLNYIHQHKYDDLMPTVQCGYTYFLNRNVTIEPEVYYNLSTKDFSEYSGFGFRIGFGIYFE